MAIPERVRESRETRYRVLAALVLGGFGLIVLALLQLQVLQRERQRELAKANRVRLDVLRAPRGALFDRRGVLLADSAPSFSIVFRPFPAESTERVRLTTSPAWIQRVAFLVAGDTAEVRATVLAANRGGQTKVLRRDAPPEVLAAVEETRAELPGLEVQIEPLRRYPYGTAMAHLLGYAGEINDVELDSLAPAGYRPGDLIGRTGVERAYEPMLRGVDGAEYVVVNAVGRKVSIFEEEPRRDPVAGHDVTLTVDSRVQLALEEAMAGVARGAGIALDPRDGGVLALVSRPAYDPNEFSHGLSVARWRELSEGGANPLLNRAIQGLYPPASTFKSVTMLAGMRHDLVAPSSHLPTSCGGSYHYGGRAFGCWQKRGHGSLDLTGALQHSCDVYFYQLGLMLGLDRLQDTAHDLGLGIKTGIDLPQERSGLVPDQAYYDKRWGAGKWRKGLLLNLAIGQGELLVTPLQLALMTAEIANGGRPVRPHVVKEVRGEPVAIGKPREAGVPADSATWGALRRALEAVVVAGTGRAAQVPGVRVAGKTGTGQNPHGEDHALFVCYAPVEDPVIALAVVVENGGHGGSVAAPIAGHVLRRMFLPDSLQKPPAGRPRRAPADSARVVRDSLVEEIGD